MYILVGCPYTRSKHIYSAAKELKVNYVDIINYDEIIKICNDHFELVSGKTISDDRVKACHIRYPYDLIPPNSGTYELREHMEFIKSLCLKFESVSINPVTSSWALRNRIYSLTMIQRFGAKVPKFEIRKKLPKNHTSEVKAVKAVGNCFVSEDLKYDSSPFRQFLHVARDGDDIAVIFPASLLNKNEISEYLTNVGTAFIQEPIMGKNEYRIYFIGKKVFHYKREQIDSFDKSEASYLKTSFMCSPEVKTAINNFMESYRVKYLCIDIIENFENQYIIDVNPYGALPEFEVHPEPSIYLLNLMIGNE